jgi:manganese/zinc/iron transport system permease protein
MIELSGSFWIILTGVLAATSCGLLGTFLVLRKMSMLGDALSHAVLPGIAIAFFFTGHRSILPMFVGAAVFGLITTLLVESLNRRWKVQEDASIGIVFTALFALGVVLISAYAGQVDLDQECVLYGEIAFTQWDILLIGGQEMGPRPVWILGSVCLLNLLLVVLFYKELVISSFDPALAVSVGINATLVHYLLMGAVSLTTVAAFESVGAILVVALLIVPGATAYLWSDRLPIILALSVLFGVIAAVGGYELAGKWDSSIAGAMVVVLGGLFVLSVLGSPNQGMVARLWQRLNLSVRVAQDHMLLGMVRRAEMQRNGWTPQTLTATAAVWRPLARLAFKRLLRQGLVVVNGGHVALSEAGRSAGLNLLRSHRLWETYLSTLGLPEDHLHDPADAVEHFIGEELQQELDAQVAAGEVDKQVDPQGKTIPKPQRG